MQTKPYFWLYPSCIYNIFPFHLLYFLTRGSVINLMFADTTALNHAYDKTSTVIMLPIK